MSVPMSALRLRPPLAWLRTRALLCITALELSGCVAPGSPAVAPAETVRAREESPITRNPGRFEAIVDARHPGVDGTLVEGTRVYRTIGAALAAATDTTRYSIFIRNGRYREKLTIDRPNVALIGESRDGTVLTFDAAADTKAPGGGTYGTRGSFTLRILARGFHARSLTIENAFDYLANAAKPRDDPTRFANPQAVALMTDGGSDEAVFVDVRLSGHQDTLFANTGRHYFVDCIILGSVDFIFGAGTAVIERSEIVSRDRGSRTNNGYITAPSTALSQPYGFVFIRSRLTKESPRMAPGSVVLGRPWHPAALPGVNSSAVYIDCWMDDHIGAKGWDRMSATDAATGTRFWYEPGDSRFFEFGSTGPGAVVAATRRILTPAEAEYYAAARVLRGWSPWR